MTTNAVKQANSITNPTEDAQFRLKKRIEERAHELWAMGGCTDGSALSNWLQAEREVSGQGSQPTAQESSLTSARSGVGTKRKLKDRATANTRALQAVRP
jgi:hypothetical protein